jgi:hypothetical protein
MLEAVDVTRIPHYREICQYKVKCQEHLVKAKVGDWQKEEIIIVFLLEPKIIIKLFY